MHTNFTQLAGVYYVVDYFIYLQHFDLVFFCFLVKKKIYEQEMKQIMTNLNYCFINEYQCNYLPIFTIGIWCKLCLKGKNREMK